MKQEDFISARFLEDANGKTINWLQILLMRNKSYKIFYELSMDETQSLKFWRRSRIRKYCIDTTL